MDEGELVQLLKKKDRRGFIHLKQYYPICRNRLSQMGIVEEDCQDLFQESIIVLYEKLQTETFKLTSEVSTFLYGVCMNKAKYHLRKNKAHISLSQIEVKSEENEEYTLREEPLSVEEAYSSDWQREDDYSLPSKEKLQQAMDALGSPCKDILIAFYYHKTRIKEIMERHGYKTENAAKVAKHKCMNRLKKRFQL